MRLFTAIQPPPSAREGLAAIQSLLRATVERQFPLSRVSWVDPGQLHLTLKFIGELPNEQASLLCQRFESIEVPSMFLDADHLEMFPHRGDAVRILAVGFRGEVDKVGRLFGDIEQVCADFGISRERRRFTPHVTLARVRDGLVRKGDWPRIDDLPPQAFIVRSFELVRSTLSSAGPVHDTLRTFDGSHARRE